MYRIIRFVFVSVLVVLAGCAGTGMQVQTAYAPDPTASISYSVISGGKLPEGALEIFNERLNSQFHATGQLANGKKSTRTVEIVVTNYYMRHGATRALVGVMAGSDNMRSTITVRESATKAALGQFSVESKNPTALFTSRGLIEDHADQIVRYVTTGAK